MMWTRRYTRPWFAWYPVEITYFKGDHRRPADLGFMDKHKVWWRWVDRHGFGWVFDRYHTLPKEASK